jgi:hypothetical protein
VIEFTELYCTDRIESISQGKTSVNVSIIQLQPPSINTKITGIMDSTPPGPPSHTPMVFMTPYLAKRKDGICPSLLLPSSLDPKQANPGGLSKHYQTKSGLLLQVKCSDAKDRAAVEFQTIIDSVKEALEELAGATEDIVSMEFNPKGCEWIMELNPSLNDADKNYFLSVICLANELDGTTNYVVDTRLTPKGELDVSPLAPPLQGYREAKATFDFVGLQVRKAIVKLEFPEFPEGCKGKPFRDVYQLNARVSNEQEETIRHYQCAVFETRTQLLFFLYYHHSSSPDRLQLFAAERTEQLDER